jgi:hypothetical protein
MMGRVSTYVKELVSGAVGCLPLVGRDIVDFFVYHVDPNTLDERVASRQAYNELSYHNKILADREAFG